MQTLLLENLNPAFHALFTNELPAALRCTGILNGVATGLFFCDSPGLCAYLIQSIEREGIHTYWNCAKQNTASTRLAKTLGFPLESEYHLWAWFRKQEGE